MRVCVPVCFVPETGHKTAVNRNSNCMGVQPDLCSIMNLNLSTVGLKDITLCSAWNSVLNLNAAELWSFSLLLVDGPENYTESQYQPVRRDL